MGEWCLPPFSGLSTSLLKQLGTYAISINSTPSSRAGAPPSAMAWQIAPGGVESACSCLLVMRSLVAADGASALELCLSPTMIPNLLEGLRAPHLGGCAHDARLLLHVLDLLFTVSEEASAPTWPYIVRHVGKLDASYSYSYPLTHSTRPRAQRTAVACARYSSTCAPRRQQSSHSFSRHLCVNGRWPTVSFLMEGSWLTAHRISGA
jgi:hypothetical protein